MATMMPTVADDGNEPQELADRFDGITFDCDDLEGFAEYDVYIKEETLESLHERQDPVEWAGHLVESHLERVLRQEKSLVSVETMAKEKDTFSSMCDDDERHFEVWARFD